MLPVTAQLNDGPILLHGPRMTVLDDVRCLDSRWAARSIAFLARGRRHFSVPPTLVMVLPVRSGVDAVRSAADAAAGCEDWPMTIRGWRGRPDGEAVALTPYWHNLDRLSAHEAIVELAALGARHHHSGGQDRIIVTCQRFVPAYASARVTVDQPAQRITVRSCWGLDETLDTVFESDDLVLSTPFLEIVRHAVVQKPNAVQAAEGGTETVSVPPSRRGLPAVGAELGRRFAAACMYLAQESGRDGQFTIALAGDGHHLLSCDLAEEAG
jgi:hypothetical protein